MINFHIIISNKRQVNNMTQKLKGIGASAGISISKTYVLEQPDFHITKRDVSDIDAEKNKYQKALDLTIAQLEKIKAIANDKLGSDKAEVFEAHIQIANDPEIKNEI
jgi:phosphotransferase system enzyme I (PtsI)